MARQTNSSDDQTRQLHDLRGRQNISERLREADDGEGEKKGHLERDVSVLCTPGKLQLPLYMMES